MGKGIGAHNSLVRLNHKTGGLRHQTRNRNNLRSVDAQCETKVVFACSHRHHHFFQCTVAGPFTQAVDRAFHLTRTTDLHAGQRVRHRHTQIVVTVHRPDGFVSIRNTLTQTQNEVAIELRNGIPHGVGQVNGGGTFINDRFNHAA